MEGIRDGLCHGNLTQTLIKNAFKPFSLFASTAIFRIMTEILTYGLLVPKTGIFYPLMIGERPNRICSMLLSPILQTFSSKPSLGTPILFAFLKNY
jgi:hypothetical protein